MDEEQVRRQAISASPSAKPYDKTASSTESPWSSHARDAIPRVANVSPPKAAAIAAPASASTAALPNPPRTEPSPVAHSAKPNAISAIARAASPPIRAVTRVTVDLSGPIHQNLSDGFAGRTTAGQAHELLSAATDENGQRRRPLPSGERGRLALRRVALRSHPAQPQRASAPSTPSWVTSTAERMTSVSQRIVTARACTVESLPT